MISKMKYPSSIQLITEMEIKVGLICTYFVYSFYNVEKDEKIHLKNGKTLPVKKGCYTKKDIEKVSSGRVKYDSLTGKSVIDPTISRFRPCMKKY